MSLEPMGRTSRPRDPMFSQEMLEDPHEIAPEEKGSAVMGSAIMMWTDEQINLIKRTVARGASNDEFQMYLHFCRASGLDPLRKQAHFQIRQGKNGSRDVIMMAGIDGMRARAEQMPDYLGISSAEVYDQDGFEIDFGAGSVKHVVKFPRKGTIIGAWARVCRKDRTPYLHWLDNTEYKGSYMANQMRGLMIKKTAEAQALRHEYPEPFSGGYAYEEFGTTQEALVNADSVVVDADVDDAVEQPKQAEQPRGDGPSDVQLERFIELIDRAMERGDLSEEKAQAGLEWVHTASGKLVGAEVRRWKAREASLDPQSEDAEFEEVKEEPDTAQQEADLADRDLELELHWNSTGTPIRRARETGRMTSS